MYKIIFLILAVLLPSISNNSIAYPPESNCIGVMVNNPYHYNTNDLKSRIAVFETGGINEPYKATNRHGYMGKYQFGKRTLKSLVKLGYLDASKNDIKKSNFLNNHSLQESAMDALLDQNSNLIINSGFDMYFGREIGGVKITMEGCLAASHLLGFYAVLYFLASDGDTSSFLLKGKIIRMKDANGTSIHKYLRIMED